MLYLYLLGQLDAGAVAGIAIFVIITVVVLVSIIIILSGIIFHNTRKIKGNTMINVC